MRTIDVVIYREGRHWVATALNVEVSSFGDSPEEARAAIREALDLFFEDEPAVEIRETAEALDEFVVVEAGDPTAVGRVKGVKPKRDVDVLALLDEISGGR